MELKEEECKQLERSKLKSEWENRARAYNDMFDYLETKGLKEKDLIEFAKLLINYLSLI